MPLNSQNEREEMASLLFSMMHPNVPSRSVTTWAVNCRFLGSEDGLGNISYCLIPALQGKARARGAPVCSTWASSSALG